MNETLLVLLEKLAKIGADNDARRSGPMPGIGEAAPILDKIPMIA